MHKQIFLPSSMKNLSRLIILFFCAMIVASASAAEPAVNLVYGKVEKNNGGSGKTFAGREIASVMSWHGAGWLERAERKTEERPDLLLQALEPKPGMVIADIGTGSGYYARQLATRVGTNGKVFAVDVQPQMLDILNKQIQAMGIKNITPVLSTERDVNLAKDSIDLAIMVDVYHELQYPIEVMTSLIKALKPDGQLVLVEFRAEDPNVPINAHHKMSQAQIKKEAALLGLTWVKTISTLPWQHVVILRK
jgi:protein-L-isoaspartate O-methyltransferase